MIHKYNRKNLIKKFKLYSGVIKQCSSIIKFNYKIYYISKRIHKLKKKFSLILKRKKNKIRLIFLRKNFRNYSFFIIKLSKIVYSNYFYNSSFLTSIFFRFFSIKKKLLLKLKFFFYFFLFLNNNVFLNDFWINFLFKKRLYSCFYGFKKRKFMRKTKKEFLQFISFKQVFLYYSFLKVNLFFIRNFLNTRKLFRKWLVKKIFIKNYNLTLNFFFIKLNYLRPKKFKKPSLKVINSYKYSPWFFKDNRFVIFFLLINFWFLKYYSSLFIFLLRSNFSLWLKFFYSYSLEFLFFDFYKSKSFFLYRSNLNQFFFFDKNLIFNFFLKNYLKTWYNSIFFFNKSLNLHFRSEKLKLNFNFLGNQYLSSYNLFEKIVMLKIWKRNYKYTRKRYFKKLTKKIFIYKHYLS